MLARLAFRHRSALLAMVGTGVAALALSTPALSAPEAITGVMTTLAGAHLRLVSIRVLGKSARVHHAGGRALRVVGPYARLRNPLYLANALITGGLALLSGGPVAAVLALALVASIYHVVVHHEEAALTAAFGDEYREYRRRVPRWLPCLRAPATTEAPAPVPWPEVVLRERALVAGVPLALVAVLLVRLGEVPLVALWEALARRAGARPDVLLLVLGALVSLANAARTERKLRRKEAMRAAEAAAVGAPAT